MSSPTPPSTSTSIFPSQPAFEIRPRLASDLPSLTTLLNLVYASDGYPVEGPSPTIITPSGTLSSFVALLDDKLVGHVLLTSAAHSLGAVTAWAASGEGREKEATAVLGRLFVDPAARGRGVGRGLVERVIGWAKGEGEGEGGGVRVVLDVLEKDQAAVGMYRRLGWRRVGGGGVYEFGGERYRVGFFVEPGAG